MNYGFTAQKVSELMEKVVASSESLGTNGKKYRKDAVVCRDWRGPGKTLLSAEGFALVRVRRGSA